MFEKFKPWLSGFLLFALFTGFFQYLVANKAVVDLHLITSEKTVFKIYYRDTGGNWSENKMSSVVIRPGLERYSFRLTDLRRVSELRIDTSEKGLPTVTVHSLELRQMGFAPVRLDTAAEFARLRQGTGIQEFSVGPQSFTVVPQSKDPNLLLPLEGLERAPQPLLHGLWLLFFAASAVFFIANRKRFLSVEFVPYCGAAVLGLIVVMAGISQFNTHPDEVIHVVAGQYYMENHLPPPVGDESIRNTYSPYGVSRLHNGETAYFFAGKFAKFLSPLQLADYLAFRLFNVGLFALLVAASYYSAQFRILFLPLLLSPQIWYIFSYFNSEGFAITVMMLAVYQLVADESTWNRLLDRAPATPSEWIKRPALAILFAALLLLKKNFYFFLVFAVFYTAWRRFFFSKKVSWGASLQAVAVVAGLGLLLVVGVRGYDSYINGWDKENRVYQAREDFAKPMYKPSTPLDDKFALLQLKDRGHSISTVFTEMQWGERIFRTSFGEYGYTTVPGSYNYYNFVRFLGLALLASVICSIVIGCKGREITLLGGALGCSLMLLVVAFYHCWTVDFQAQGRYLLPMVAMGAMVLHHCRTSLANVFCGFFAGMLFLTAFCSFIFVGIAGIGKMVLPML